MSIQEIRQKINFRQPKYMLPAILYVPVLIALYFIVDLFHWEKTEAADKSLQTTEYLNAELPGAKTKGDGIGSKYENMAKSWGKISDATAVDNIERDRPDENKEQYESQYTADELNRIAQEEAARTEERQVAAAKSQEQQALAELEKALAEARLQGRKTTGLSKNDIGEEYDNETSQSKAEAKTSTKPQLTINEDARRKPSETEKPAEVVKKVKTTSDYFNTLSVDDKEPMLIKAIIDENVKATEGSRVRLRLLDEVEIDGHVLKRGAYLYAIMSGFPSQRVKGTVSSVMVDDEIVKVSLSLYDTDGLEGLYVPSSSFRETSKDVASGAVGNTMTINDGTSSGNTLSQWGMQTLQNAYQKTSNAISKAIKKNKVKLKYGTFVYVINSKEKTNN